MKLRSLVSLLLAALGSARADATISTKVRDDMLELRCQGRSETRASHWEWRLIPWGEGQAAEVPWVAFPAPGEEGAFELVLPVPVEGWDRLEMRARDGERILATATEPNALVPRLKLLSEPRVEALPDAVRAPWLGYLERSRRAAMRERQILAAECRQLGRRASQPAPEGKGEFEFDDKKTALSWYGTEEASRLADVVLSYQTPSGGWSKAVDYAKGPRPPGTHWTSQSEKGWHYCGTLDNRATTEQVRFLARVAQARGREDCREGALRGIEWLLAAQFPNGGWPQVYPLEAGYHEAITYNDGAVSHALEVLHDVSRGAEPYQFADEALRQRAGAAFDRGLQCILKTQVRQGGRRTVWCAQHDPLTLEPVAARLKEPPSLSGGESADLLKFLLKRARGTGEVDAAVRDALEWLAAKQLTGLRKIKDENGRTDYVEDATCKDVLWARFYSLETGLPVFPGADDGVIYPTYHEMSRNNRVAYDYFTTKPAPLLRARR